MGVAVLAIVGGVALGWVSTWFARASASDKGTAVEHLWIVPVALAAQIAWANWLSALPGSPAATRVVVPVSTAALLLVVLSNGEWPAARLVALGIALNLAVIVANGNLMPISMPNAMVAVPAAQTSGLSEGQPLPTTKDVVVAPSRTRLAFLSDHIAFRLPYGPTRMLSPGDVFVMAGLAWWIAHVTRRSLLQQGLRRRKGSTWLRTSEPAGSSSFPATGP